MGEDSLDVPEPWINGLSTGVVVMTKHSAPTNSGLETGFDKTSDDSTDDQYNLTLDIGVYRPVAIGNLVFNDSNTNGRADSGEGVDGITVELYRSTQVIGTDLPLLTTVTTNGGKYLFFDLRAGGYRVHIPQSMFEPGGPLYGKISVPEGLNGDDDVGENGIDAGDLSVSGISSDALNLYAGQAPTDENGETGIDAASDNLADAATDLTIDFGFQNPVGIGNLVFMDTNDNGLFDTGEGVDGVTVELYPQGQTPGENVPLFTQVTSNGGRYVFNYLPSGYYFVNIPASEFGPGQAAARRDVRHWRAVLG